MVRSKADHSGVVSTPSNSTVDKSSRTNAISEGETEPGRRRPAPNGRSHSAGRDAPTSDASVGAKRAKVPNTWEKTSPCASHVSRPKRNMPAKVRAEYPSARQAMWDGTAGFG